MRVLSSSFSSLKEEKRASSLLLSSSPL